MMRDGLRTQFPRVDEAELEIILRKKLRRLRQLEQHGLYQKASA